MSVHGDERCDDTTPVFTQEEVFMIGGYLGGLWGVGTDEAVDGTEQAVRAVLSRERS